MTLVAAVGIMVAVCCALYGWGYAVRRLTTLPPGTWPVTLVLGLASWIFLGGLLNLARLAYPAALDALVVIGLGLAAWRLRAVGLAELWRSAWPRSRAERIHRLVWFGLVAGIMGYTLSTQLEPTLFNQHDDLQKYFAHAARMVQTGTLFGSPLNALGSETLGGQAFLQGFVVGWSSLIDINAVDAGLCLLLTLLVAGGIALGRPSIAPAALLNLLLVWAIDPLYVSVTALYSGAALISGLTVLSLDPREYAVDVRDAPPAAAIGLCYAALVALKMTLALFVAVHGLAMLAAMMTTGRRRDAFWHGLKTAAWALAFLGPWIALYAPYYQTALTAPVHSQVAPPALPPEPFNPLSTQTLLYGESYAQYSFLILVLIAYGGMALWLGRAASPAATRRLAAICAGLAAGYVAMLLVAGPLLAGRETALRHFVPLLIGTVPVLASLGALLAASPQGRASRLASLLTIGLAIASLAWFAPNAVQRARLLADNGTMLAYLASAPPTAIEHAIDFETVALYGDRSQELAELQRRVPAGAPLLVWNATPFLLDFARNPIIDVDLAGFGTPWSRVPPLSYVLWQYRGVGVRQPANYQEQMRGPGRRDSYLAARGDRVAAYLASLLPRAQILFSDGQTVLFKVTSPPELP